MPNQSVNTDQLFCCRSKAGRFTLSVMQSLIKVSMVRAIGEAVGEGSALDVI